MMGILVETPENFMNDEANRKAVAWTQAATISKLLSSTNLPFRSLFDVDYVLHANYQSEFQQKETFYSIKNRIIGDKEVKQKLACEIAYHLSIIKMLKEIYPDKSFQDITEEERLNEILLPAIKKEYERVYRLQYGKYLKKVRSTLKNINPKK